MLGFIGRLFGNPNIETVDDDTMRIWFTTKSGIYTYLDFPKDTPVWEVNEAVAKAKENG